MNAKTTPAKTSRKRKRSGESLSEDSEDGSKKRGRPRTEKPDESTADVSAIGMFSFRLLPIAAVSNSKTDINSSVEGHRSAWLKGLTDSERKLPWTTCGSVSLISLPP